MHPGSGSQRPLILRNRLERNGIGLFWCWGVKYGLAEENRIDANRNYGISIDHNDNMIRNNEIRRSGRVGILFRDESRGQDFWANRNLVEGNRIVDSGGTEGIGIDIQGRTKDVRIIANEIRETRGRERRIGIRVAQEAGAVELAGNTIEGFDTSVADLRKRAS